MVGSFSRAFGGCRANFSKFRSSQAKFAFNGAKAGARRKVFIFFHYALHVVLHSVQKCSMCGLGRCVEEVFHLNQRYRNVTPRWKRRDSNMLNKVLILLSAES